MWCRWLNGSRYGQIAFFYEWAELLAEDAYDECWAPLHTVLQDEPDAVRHNWNGFAVLLTAQMMCDYEKRFKEPSQRFPLLIMWMIFKLPHEKCSRRQSCAKDLLSRSKDDIGDESIWKLRELFRREISAAANTGTLDARVHDFIHGIAAAWDLDTTEIEGINSIIKVLTKRSAVVTWKLLSARIGIKKTIATTYPGPAAVDDLLRICLDHHAETQEFMKLNRAETRFAEIKVSDYPLCPPAPKLKLDNPGDVFAAKMVVSLKKLYAMHGLPSWGPDESHVLVCWQEVREPPVGPDGFQFLESCVKAWLASYMFRSDLWGLQMNCQQRQPPFTGEVSFELDPPVARSLHEEFVAVYKRARCLNNVKSDLRMYLHVYSLSIVWNLGQTSRASIVSGVPLLQNLEVLDAKFPGSVQTVRRRRGRCDDVASEAQRLLLERQAEEAEGDIEEKHDDEHDDDPVLDLDATQIQNVISHINPDDYDQQETELIINDVAEFLVERDEELMIPEAVAGSDHVAEPHDEDATAWSANWTAWATSLEGTLAACQHVGGDTCQEVRGNLCVSMVMQGQPPDACVRFVAWDNFADNIGRWARLDQQQRVVFATASTREKFAVGSLSFLVASTGVRMERVSEAFRTEMPLPILRVRDCINAWLGVRASGVDRCCLCEAHNPRDALVCCPLCLRQAHSKCLESGLAHQPDNLSFNGMSAGEALVAIQASCMKCVEASDVCDWCELIWQSAS